jgi:hypothetical protein
MVSFGAVSRHLLTQSLKYSTSSFCLWHISMEDIVLANHLYYKQSFLITDISQYLAFESTWKELEGDPYVWGKATQCGHSQNKGPRMRQQPSPALHFGNFPHPWALAIVQHKVNPNRLNLQHKGEPKQTNCTTQGKPKQR